MDSSGRKTHKKVFLNVKFEIGSMVVYWEIQNNVHTEPYQRINKSSFNDNI